jgi:hypothetical protein
MDVARVAEMMRDRGVDDIMVVEGRSLVGALSLAEAGKAGTARTIVDLCTSMARSCVCSTWSR